MKRSVACYIVYEINIHSTIQQHPGYFYIIFLDREFERHTIFVIRYILIIPRFKKATCAKVWPRFGQETEADSTVRGHYRTTNLSPSRNSTRGYKILLNIQLPGLDL
ncbi:hypothetical protein B566_EDAN006503 [Ephemera danica]|nr:hypothetical protein B566_EDAN006503 [Ephemera danica]